METIANARRLASNGQVTRSFRTAEPVRVGQVVDGYRIEEILEVVDVRSAEVAAADAAAEAEGDRLAAMDRAAIEAEYGPMSDAEFAEIFG